MRPAPSNARPSKDTVQRRNPVNGKDPRVAALRAGEIPPPAADRVSVACAPSTPPEFAGEACELAEPPAGLVCPLDTPPCCVVDDDDDGADVDDDGVLPDPIELVA